MENRKEAKMEYRYSTSEMLSMYGLTNKGLFYYEKKGVIAPERASENQYRVFTMKECSRLFMARTYGKYGLSVGECAEAVENIGASDLLDVISLRREAIMEEARYRMALVEELEKTAGLLNQMVAGEDMSRLLTSPAMLRMEIRKRPDEPAAAPENSDAFLEWLGYLPFSAASMRIDRDTLIVGGNVKYTLGFIMPLETAGRLGLSPGRESTVLPTRRCFYTILEGSDTYFFEPARFRSALEKIAGLGLLPSGDPFTRMIGIFDMGRGMLRYDEAWFPVD